MKPKVNETAGPNHINALQLHEFARRAMRVSANAERMQSIEENLRVLQEMSYELFCSGLLPATTDSELRTRSKQAQLQYREVLRLTATVRKVVKAIVES